MAKLPVLSLLVCLLLSGCGLIDEYFLPVSEDTVQEIYENGNDAMRAGEYAKAAESYARIKDDYPFSPYAVEAELSLADAYFLNKKYAEAAEAYRDFETLHPRHSAIPYVLDNPLSITGKDTLFKKPIFSRQSVIQLFPHVHS